MTTPLFQVDAFTDRPFAGNPAAVCILTEGADEGWMQNLAREMNLSETAFVAPSGDGWNLRWFTPTPEVDLCGHATLASAHVLWEQELLPSSAEARFDTRSGRLTAVRDGDWIVLDFPSVPAEPAEAPGGLGDMLGARPRSVSRSVFDYLVEVADEAEVLGARPNFRRLAEVDARGVIVTAPALGGGADFVSRFFAPASGIDEDPVTGSAHCTLAPFWAERLGKTRLTGRQVSARGGIVRVELRGERVALAGQAVTVMSGIVR